MDGGAGAWGPSRLCVPLGPGEVLEGCRSGWGLGTDRFVPACQEPLACVAALCLKPAFVVTCHLVVARPCGGGPFALCHLQRPQHLMAGARSAEEHRTTRAHSFHLAAPAERSPRTPEPRGEDGMSLLCQEMGGARKSGRTCV